MGKVLIRILSLLLISIYVYGNNSSQRIGGISQFLIDRANDNYLFIFENNIKNNKSLNCYFKNTKENLEFAGLKELMISEELWESSLEQDLDILLTRSSAKYIENTFKFSKKSSSLWGDYLDILKYIEIKYKGEFYPLTSLPTDANKELKDLVNSFYTHSLNINETLKYFGKFAKKQLCETPVVGSKEFLSKINDIYKIEDSVKDILDTFRKYIKNNNLRVVPSAKKELKDNLIGTMEDELSQLVSENHEAIKDIKEFIQLLETYESDETTTTVKVVSALKVIRAKSDISEKRFKKLKKHVMFFAQISEAKSSEEVSTILMSYAIPPVSFFEKRQSNERWLINSYLGVFAGKSNTPDSEANSNDYGIYAPIGIEYSHSIDNGASLSYMISPFDFGYPISLKLNGVDEDVEYEQIIAPSIGITYGFANSPLALGIVFQKGKKYDSTKEQEKKVFLHLSFDMPLFILK